MKIALSGSSGLIGSALAKSLLSDSHTVLKLVRPGGPVGAGTVAWNPETAVLDSRALEGVDVVIHLAGKNLASEKWTEENKTAFTTSRVKSTKLLCSRIRQLEKHPQLVIIASAIGYYGNRGGEELTEESSPGEGFLPELTMAWEKASEILADTGIRVVKLRFGVVFSPDGGALPQMIKPFKLGIGGKLGDGSQYVSWVSIDDVIEIIKYTISNDTLSGPINVVSPTAVTNKQLTSVLAKALKRPAVAKIPAFALRIMFGEMADAMLLSSTRVIPGKLLESGYKFKDTDLEDTLSRMIK